MRVNRCDGFNDLSPQEMSRFRLIEQAFRDCCLGWGFDEVRTPTIEHLYLFTSAGTLTPGMLGKVYSFLDWDGWSGQRVVLRPDGTIPVTRFYIDKLKRGLARLFYVSNIFRFEETGKEARERWQGGVELIGVNSTLADVELITMALEALSRVGIKRVELRLSHAGVIRSLLSRLNLSPREQAQVFDGLLDGDTEALAGIKAARSPGGKALSFLLYLKGNASAILKNTKALLKGSYPELETHLDNLVGVAQLLESLGIRFSIDIASGRGFEYYTGVIFQLFSGGAKVGGGGRYDALIPQMGGGDIPASGFALYFEHLMDLLAALAPVPTAVARILVRVAAEVIKRGVDVARLLRDRGYVVELELGTQKPAGYDWLLEVAGEKYVLTDKEGRRRFELKDADEVCKRLGEGDAG